ncbi:hypothetical protein B0H10DRAFT_2003418 [Mycena sp. CBHHK59/15]|nr:hypothetical protein B0H10DRAFT_2003418 [Mycena sp. CBHHK59/15]
MSHPARVPASALNMLRNGVSPIPPAIQSSFRRGSAGDGGTASPSAASLIVAHPSGSGRTKS